MPALSILVADNVFSLRIAPPEAPVSGYMFGKGIYLADVVSKSANYCIPGVLLRPLSCFDGVLSDNAVALRWNGPAASVRSAVR